MMSVSRTRLRQTLALAVALSAFAIGGCSVNPATGKRQIALISEQQEIAMGLESAKGAVAQYGRYPDDELQAYVSEIGLRLAAASERPQLPWSFTVIDDPTVNAFALPGGQIFVTRGILTHFNSEAELASVLGHEIGHVTARHSVEQMSTQQLASLGLGVAMIASEDVRPYAGMVAQGMQLMFLKFSRDDESQSDMLGLRYMTRTGYDPNQMPKMFITLNRISARQGGGRIPAWASTHPDPVNREQATYQRIAGLPPGQQTGAVNRDGYLRRLEGVVFGDDPRQGYFIGTAFYHPELEFKLLFPDGWQTMNTRQFVAAVSPQENAIVQLSLADKESATAAAEAFFSGAGIERGPSWRRDFHQFRITPSDQRPTVVRGLVGFIEHGGLVYRLVGYTTDDRWQSYQQTLEGSLGTFSRVTQRRYLDVTPKTVELVELPRAMTISQLNRRYPSTVDDASLAIANGVELDTVIPAGTLVKRVVGGRLPER